VNQTVSVWLVILAALVAANLPFVNHRLLAVIPFAADKALPWRLLELVFFMLWWAFLPGAWSKALVRPPRRGGSSMRPRSACSSRWPSQALSTAIFSSTGAASDLGIPS